MKKRNVRTNEHCRKSNATGHPKLTKPEILPGDFELETLRACPGGRRLSLRLTTKCDLNCIHCTLRDMPELPDRSRAQALESLRAGRLSGCDDLVVLRGEAGWREDLPELIVSARTMGFRFVQLQSHGAPFAIQAKRAVLLAAGIDAVEVMLLGGRPETHDTLARHKGAFRATMLGIKALLVAGVLPLVSIHVLSANLAELPMAVRLLSGLGAPRVQFNFPRPVLTPEGPQTEPLARLAPAAAAVNGAAALAHSLGLAVTTEGFPFCLLEAAWRQGPDSDEDWKRHRIDDLHFLHESLNIERERMRPMATVCQSCSVAAVCPKTWAMYLELFGEEELRAFSR